MKIIFFGTPEIARTILERLISSPNFKPVCVVTSPDEPVGRSAVPTPSSVKQYAQQQDIPFLQPEKLDTDFAKKIADFKPDLFIVVAYGKIFPPALLQIPKKGSVNIHFSLLPLWRGASPIQHAILNGDKETGTTIMLMDEKLDHGPILMQKIIQIPQGATYASLSKELAQLSANLLCQTIPLYAEDKLHPQEQDHARATYCKILCKEDGKIDWSLGAAQIERMIRAFAPWPGTYTFWNEKRIKIHHASVLKQHGRRREIGAAFLHERVFAIQTGKELLIPSIVQLEGKAKMNAETFLRGYPSIIGSLLA